jgi:hypothetical protein
MRYVVIKYKGSHSISITDRDLMYYEFSDNLEYLREKYSLIPVTNEFDWKIENNGFSIYMISREDGILLVDMKFVSLDWLALKNISPLINAIERDQILNNILNNNR